MGFNYEQRNLISGRVDGKAQDLCDTISRAMRFYTAIAQCHKIERDMPPAR